MTMVNGADVGQYVTMRYLWSLVLQRFPQRRLAGTVDCASRSCRQAVIDYVAVVNAPSQLFVG
eukprot:930058-Prorocentrum_lima.AAC.1